MKYSLTPGSILTSVCGSYFLVSARQSIEINDTTAFYIRQLEKGVNKDDLLSAAKEAYELNDDESTSHDIDDLLAFLLKNRFLMRYRE